MIIHNLYIPNKCGISNGDFRQDERRAFNLAWELREFFKKSGQPLWSSCVIKVLGTKMFTEFDYTPWLESDYSSGQQMDYFEYKYLGKKAVDDKEQAMFDAMESFQKQYNTK